MPTKAREVAHAKREQKKDAGGTPTIEALERLTADVVAKLPRSALVTVSANEKLLAPKELADFLGVSVTTVSRLYQAGGLPFLPVGDRVRFSRSEVLATLRQQRQARLAKASGGASKIPR